MKLFCCLALTFISTGQTPLKHRHWCHQPTQQLRWLDRMIREAKTFPAFQPGWEVHQARYWGQEVFVLHLFRVSGNSRGFLVYNHYGDLVATGERADSIQLSDLVEDRLLAASAVRLRKRR